jgi:hypothetical protein
MISTTNKASLSINTEHQSLTSILRPAFSRIVTSLVKVTIRHPARHPARCAKRDLTKTSFGASLGYIAAQRSSLRSPVFTLPLNYRDDSLNQPCDQGTGPG